MAWTSSACPRESSARERLDDRRAWLETRKATFPLALLAAEPLLPLAALAHLTILALDVLVPGVEPPSFLFVASGLVLVMLAVLRPRSAADMGPTGDDTLSLLTPDPGAGAMLSGATALDRTLALERQSQRLVEIADAATRARREAEIRERLWTDLTARMSHELRTPLNAVIGFSDIMNAELFGPIGHDRYREYVQHIRECGRDLLKSTEDTLALAASLGAPSPAGPQRPVPLALLVEDAIGFFSAEAAARGLEIEMVLPAGVEILGARRPVRQVLINLLAEAVLRAPAGGGIVITAAGDGGIVELSVAVAGGEPRPEAAPQSLALCIARTLAELNGSMIIESVDRDGTTWRAATFLDHAAQADFFP